jgi:hypothetical protein
LFPIAASRSEWELPVLVAKLTFNTTAAGTELRHLRFEDVVLDSGQTEKYGQCGYGKEFVSAPRHCTERRCSRSY